MDRYARRKSPSPLTRPKSAFCLTANSLAARFLIIARARRSVTGPSSGPRPNACSDPSSSRKGVLEALQCRDAEFVREQALSQEQAGAAYIDLNAAALMDDEIEGLRWAIPLLQYDLSIPLSIDTPNPRTMEAALKIHKERGLLNSVTGEKSSLETMLPIIREFKPPKPS